jgi:hypothetical protein
MSRSFMKMELPAGAVTLSFHMHPCGIRRLKCAIVIQKSYTLLPLLMLMFPLKARIGDINLDCGEGIEDFQLSCFTPID